MSAQVEKRLGSDLHIFWPDFWVRGVGNRQAGPGWVQVQGGCRSSAKSLVCVTSVTLKTQLWQRAVGTLLRLPCPTSDAVSGIQAPLSGSCHSALLGPALALF